VPVLLLHTALPPIPSHPLPATVQLNTRCTLVPLVMEGHTHAIGLMERCVCGGGGGWGLHDTIKAHQRLINHQRLPQLKWKCAPRAPQCVHGTYHGATLHTTVLESASWGRPRRQSTTTPSWPRTSATAWAGCSGRQAPEARPRRVDPGATPAAHAAASARSATHRCTRDSRNGPGRLSLPSTPVPGAACNGGGRESGGRWWVGGGA
jgi:hypothetical protein